MPVNDEIFERMGELAPAEKKVARTLLASYPSAGLQSAAALAKAAGTSTPTVLRLVARLGINSYPEFQRLLREEITHHMNSPVSRTQHSTVKHTESGVLQDAVTNKLPLIHELPTSVPPSEFDHAVQLLAAGPRQVTISGGYFTRYMAMLLSSQLDQVIPNVEYVQELFGHDVSKYLRLGSGSVAIILDFRRYELAAKQTAELAKSRGATVIVITDQGLSPASESADIVLPVTVDGVPFDSVVALLVLIEALVEAVMLASGERGIARMKQWEDSVQIARAYRSPAAMSVDLTTTPERQRHEEE
ncbi:MurR/RpiR family transcriptional regulator [Gryllotalpicola reticulitermitis]|uniref:MurR/RpiR family transcriptional regulator n=1 Tax=Gryllotalpicola reticulitermitis TaxID=1184153 RepID=A0ABV8Q4E3_9MICO